MTAFKKFLENAKLSSDKSSALPTTEKLTNIISPSLTGLSISNGEAVKFSAQIAELAKSPKVIDELSNELGSPKINETEDEFVDRAKITLKNILKRHLSK